MRHFIRGIIFLCALINVVNAASIDEIPHIKRNIAIDGSVNSSEWGGARVISLDYETWPADSKPTPEYRKTEIHLFEDGDALYIGVKAYDEAPNAIKANYSRRDHISGDDHIAIFLDTFHQNQEAYAFVVNPLGGQQDYIVTKDNGSESWDGLWESAGQLTEFGYALEIRIPIKTIRFSVKPRQEWGFRIWRRVVRDTSYTYEYTPVDRDNQCVICQYPTFQLLDNAQPSKAIQVRPHVLAQRSRSRAYPYDGAFTTEDELDAGVDVRWNLNADHVFNATINPDFSQVEADELQYMANRRFSIYYDEKRTFFLEGIDYFKGTANIVHTRNMVDPEYGLKYTGRIDKDSVGLFYVKDNQTVYSTPGVLFNDLISLDENSDNWVLRYKKGFESGAHIGATATSRESATYKSDLISIDSYLNPSDNIRINTEFATSDEQILGNQPIKGDLIYVDYAFNNERHWHWVGYRKKDENFRAGLGFINQVGTSELWGGAGYLWQSNDSEAWWERILFDVSYYDQKTLDLLPNQSSKDLYQSVTPAFIIEGKSDLYLELTTTLEDEFYDGQNFENQRYGLYLSRRFGINTTIGTDIRQGEAIDYFNGRQGKMRRNRVWLSTRIGAQFGLSANYTVNEHDYLGQWVFDESVLNIKTEYSIGFNHYFRLSTQARREKYNTAFMPQGFLDREEYTGYQFLYLYQVDSYTSLYAGYSSNYANDSQIITSKKTGDYVFLKINYVFET